MLRTESEAVEHDPEWIKDLFAERDALRARVAELEDALEHVLEYVTPHDLRKGPVDHGRINIITVEARVRAALRGEGEKPCLTAEPATTSPACCGSPFPTSGSASCCPSCGAPMSLEEILNHLAAFGAPMLWRMKDGDWCCRLEVFVPNEGVTVDIKSSYRDKSAMAAAASCKARLDALQQNMAQPRPAISGGGRP